MAFLGPKLATSSAAGVGDIWVWHMFSDIRPALRAFLLVDATISAAAGGTRVHPAVLAW